MIQYIEPEAENVAAVGLDIGSDAVRRDAAERWMRTGRPTLTAPVALVQLPAEQQVGFLLLLAVCETPQPWTPSCVKGWAYAPLSLGRMLHGFDVEREGARLVLTDVTDARHPVRMYPQADAERAIASPAVQRELDVFGRTWRADLTPTPAFGAAPARSPWGAAGAVALLSGALAVVIVAQGRRTERAWARAVDDARLHAVVESLDDAIIGTDGDGRIVNWSGSARALLGYEDAAILGRPVAALVETQTRRDGPETPEANAPETRWQREERWTHRNGHLVPVWVTRSAVKDTGGRIVGWWLVLRDLTPARAVEERLRDGERRFRDLAESLPHMVWTCRVEDGACDYLSPQWVAYTGLPAALQLGYRWLEQLHPDDVELTRQRWAAAAEVGGSFDTEFRVRRHDGVYRWFKTRAVLTRDASGRPLKWYGSNTDIQALKDAALATEQAARTLEERVAIRTRDLAAANVALAATKKQLELAQQISHVGSWERDELTGEIRWSAEFARLLGRDPAAAPPSWTAHADLFDPPSWQAFRDGIALVADTGDPFEGMLTVVRADGSPALAVVRAEAVRDPDGIRSIAATFQDVTARERQAATVRQLSERLRLATSAAQLGVWEWEVATGRLLWDDAMHEIYQVPPERFTGTVDVWEHALHPDDRATASALLRDTFDGRAEFRTTFRIVRSDGSERRIRAEAALLRSASGVPERMIGVNRDVTEEWAAQLARRASEAKLQMALENAAHGLWDWHVPSGHLHVDARWAAIMGCPPQSTSGDVAALWTESLHPETRDAVLAELRRALDSDAYVYRVDYKAVRVDGRAIWVNSCGRVYERDAAGQPLRMMGTINDITARKEAEGRLLESLAEKEVLLREIHHRVKNNLAVISSLLYLQSTTTSDPAVGALLEDGRSRVQSMALVHEQLYRSTNLADIRLDLYVRQLAETLLHGMRPHARVAMRFDLDPISVDIDRAVPCGLLLNELITNALKHAFAERPAGVLDVRVKACEGACVLEVQDDGVGIDPGTSDTTESLGLLLIRTLSAQLGSECEVHSSPAGTTMRVRFAVDAGTA